MNTTDTTKATKTEEEDKTSLRRYGPKVKKKIKERDAVEAGNIPIYLQFEKVQYKEFRRILFKEGIWPQEFLKFALASLVHGNVNSHAVLADLKREKACLILNEEGGVVKRKINVENIYDLIEISLNENQLVSGSKKTSI